MIETPALYLSEFDAHDVFSRLPRSLFEAAFRVELRAFEELRSREPKTAFHLFRREGQWCVSALAHPEWKPLQLDYSRGPQAERLKKAWLSKELLKDALSFRKGESLAVVDATAGLLGDATLLATWGHQVTAFEQNPLLCFLGLEALAHLREAGQNLDISLFCAAFPSALASEEISKRHAGKVDRVYLDPLYPSRPKDALNSKELRLVAELARGQAQPELGRMIEAGLSLGPSRVVVKRPQWEELLKHSKYQVTSCEGRSTRFDVVHAAS
jgi:16S rRNA (guanine1516-N2)-methyltransferase